MRLTVSFSHKMSGKPLLFAIVFLFVTAWVPCFEATLHWNPASFWDMRNPRYFLYYVITFKERGGRGGSENSIILVHIYVYNKGGQNDNVCLLLVKFSYAYRERGEKKGVKNLWKYAYVIYKCLPRQWDRNSGPLQQVEVEEPVVQALSQDLGMKILKFVRLEEHYVYIYISNNELKLILKAEHSYFF